VEIQDNNKQRAEQGMPVMLVAQPVVDDEINLFDLWRTLTKRKFLIAVITVITTSFGLAYALLATSTYQSSTLLTPPTMFNIIELNRLLNASKVDVGRKSEKHLNSIPLYTPKEVFTQYSKALSSISIRRDFFLHSGIAEKLAPEAKTELQLRNAFSNFDGALTFSAEKGVLTFVGNNPEVIAETLNSFVSHVELYLKMQFVTDLNSNIELSKDLLKRSIASKVALEKEIRNDQTVRLKEAISVAKKLGIENYRVPSSGGSPTTAGSALSISATVNIPLYMRGRISLQAELDSLKERKDEKVYIPGLRVLQNQLAEFDALKLSPDKIRLVRVDDPAFAPQHRISPKRKSIVVGSMLFGFAFALLIVFLAEYAERNREKYSSC